MIPRYPWPNPTNERIKELEQENAELRQQAMDAIYAKAEMMDALNEAKAEAWQEGHDTLREYAIVLNWGGDDPRVVVGESAPNPYKEK